MSRSSPCPQQQWSFVTDGRAFEFDNPKHDTRSVDQDRAGFLSDLLGYIGPEIDWEFVGIDEQWREGVRVVFGSASKTIPWSLAG
jgi:hypothetical protein